jgi:hypothetical protein
MCSANGLIPRVLWLLAGLLGSAAFMPARGIAEDAPRAAVDQQPAAEAPVDTTTNQPSDAGNTAVRTGREVLSAPPDRFPWYDSEHDGLRRVETGTSGTGGSRSGRRSSKSRWRRGGRGNSSNDDGDDQNFKDGDGDSTGGDSGDGMSGGSGSSRDDSSSSSPFSLDPTAAGATWLIWAAWFAIGAALGVLAFYLIRAFLNREARAAKDSQSSDAPDEPSGAEALPAAVPLPKGDLWTEIGRLYEAGDYSRAIIYLYAYQLIKLDQHHCIRLAKGKTNREYVHELSPRPELQGLLARTMVPFESVFFGGHSLDRAGFEACWQEAESFRRLVEQAVA